MANKTLPGGSTVSYTYTTGGRTATRTNARGIVTSYAYTPSGDLQSVTYSDNTAPVTFAQGRNGQAATVTHAGSTYAYAYNDFGQVTQESVSGGTLAGVSLVHNYDALRRRTGLAAATGAASISQAFGYDPLVSRLKTVTQGNRGATYNYHSNSALLASIEHSTDGQVKMTELREYDALNRLTLISTASSAAMNALNRATAYTYNSANQRTLAASQDGSYWTYQYDGFGHVTSADRHMPNGDLMAGRQFDYAYGGLGNRTAASFGGDAAGGSMQNISYTAAAGDRNQYASIANPGVVVTTGEANAAASVTVDSVAAIRQSDWFAQQTSVDNSAGAVYASIDIEATQGTDTDNITRKELVPAANVTQTHDADGNLTFDGYRDYTWDAENRLTSIEVRDALVPLGAPKYRIEFKYDYSGRRISTKTFGGSVGNWSLANETKYIYDGWNVIAEFSGTGLISKSYLWGLDLSGSMQGAGGVGGLLSIEQHLGDGASRHYVAYDGNGNVVGLADADTGEMSALYEYSAFGEVLQMEGSYAVKNDYRFSTKPQEGMTGLYYYGYRWLDAGSGRWLSRDPIGEAGGVNLYGFIQNDGVNRVDYLGKFEALAGKILGENLLKASEFQTGSNHPAYPKLQDWHYTLHSITVKCATKSTSEEIRKFTYDKLRRFSQLNDPVDNIATVELLEHKENYYARFKLEGVPGAMSFLSGLLGNAGNSKTLDVLISANEEDALVQAETLGQHVLIGRRQWFVNVSSSSPRNVIITTHAYEQFRSYVGELGGSSAKKEMNKLWTIYLENTAYSVAKKYGGTVEELIFVEGQASFSFPPFGQP